MKSGRFVQACCALWLTACAPTAVPEAELPDEAPSVDARWVSPEAADKVTWLEGAAHVLQSPEASSVLSVPMTARVLRVRVRPGQRVKRDEPLVDVLLPELLSAAGAFSAANLRIEAYTARKQRLGPLVEQGLSRSADLSEVEANLALARAEREAARATLRVSGARESEIAKLLSGNGTLSLRAPADAMVVRVAARPGEVRDPNSGPLVELVGEGQLQVEARFMVTPPAGVSFVGEFAGRRLALTLDAFSPRAAPEDGSRTAWFHATNEPRGTNDEGALVAGSLGRVRWEPAKEWLAIPLAALRSAGQDMSVFALVEGKPVSRRVEVIARSHSDAIVTGLTDRDRIAADAKRVIEGAQR